MTCPTFDGAQLYYFSYRPLRRTLVLPNKYRHSEERSKDLRLALRGYLLNSITVYDNKIATLR